MLPQFQAALIKHKAAIGYDRIWRYRQGKIPRIVLWIAENLDLAQALVADAVELQRQRETAPAHGQPGQSTAAIGAD